MRRGLFVAFITLFFLTTPSPSHAQQQSPEVQALIRALLAQVAVLQEQLRILQLQQGIPSASCNITRTLTRGSSGEDVACLQNFLISRGHLESGNDTGYFGPLTEAGVKAFQTQQGIVSSGSPTTTGYGAVGPRTRAAMAQQASAGTPITSLTPTTPIFTTPPSGGGGGGGLSGAGGGGGGDDSDSSGDDSSSGSTSGEVVSGLPPSPQRQNAGQVPLLFSINWEVGQDYPIAIQTPAAAVLDGHLISVGGYFGGILPEQQKVSELFGKGEKFIAPNVGFMKRTYARSLTADDSWRLLPDFPGHGRQYASGITVNNRLYVWGGFYYDASVPEAETYKDGWSLRNTGSSWTWEKLPDLPVGIAKPGIAAIGSKIYIMGGADFALPSMFPPHTYRTIADRNNTTMDKKLGARLWVIDTSDLSKGFTELPKLPGTPRFIHAFASAGGKLYAIGGRTGQDDGYCTVIDNWRFDPQTEVWERVRDMPIAAGAYDSGGIVYQDRYIFLIGGIQAGCGVDFNSRIQPLSEATYGRLSAVYPEHGLHNDILVYDTQTNSFGRADSLPIDNNLPEVVIHNGVLHMLGSEIGRFATVLNGTYYWHKPDLYLRGTIIPPRAAPDLAFPQLSIVNPLYGTVAASTVELSGVCNQYLSSVFVYGPFAGSPLSAPCIKNNYAVKVVPNADPGNRTFRVEQRNATGARVQQHQISLFIPYNVRINSPADNATVTSSTFRLTGYCNQQYPFVYIHGSNIQGSPVQTPCSNVSGTGRFDVTVTRISGSGTYSVRAEQRNSENIKVYDHQITLTF